MGRAAAKARTELDLSDVERRVGQKVGGGELIDACSATDIRRWVMAMDYPNPLHWDEDFAKASRFGGIVAPQSFAVAMDYGHGVQPACVGHIPGSHLTRLVNGGDEWWHYGKRLRPGDRLRQERRFLGYTVSETEFAGPTVFSRGDTLHFNQDGAPVSRHRATAIRYLAAEAEKRGVLNQVSGDKPGWSREQLDQVERERHAWLLSNRAGRSPRFAEVAVGDRLPRRVIGPHTVASLATEYRAFVFNIWGSFKWVAPAGVADPWVNQDPGWVAGFGFDEEGASVDPRLRDGLYVGPSRGHVDSDKAAKVGMPRAFGYASSMGAWVTDYVAYWAGQDGFIRHSITSYQRPPLEGDVTCLEAEVAAKQTESGWGTPLVQLAVSMNNQDGGVLATATVDVELPL
jgi:hypothetical protein